MLKKVNEVIADYERFVTGLIGKFVHAPVNEFISYDPLLKKDIEVNAWFAGKVAGYEKTLFAYDYENDVFFEENKVVHKVLLCDGMAYAMSEDKLEMLELTEEEFIDMVAKHQAKENAKRMILEG